MIDRPLDQIFSKFRNGNEQNKDFLKFIFEKSDAMSLWVIGLSAGALPLLLSNVAVIKKVDPTINLRFLVICLCISVIAGIIYRVLFLYWYTLQVRISEEVSLAFTIEKGMHLESRLTGNETIEQLALVVQDTTGSDYSPSISFYNNLDEAGKKFIYDDLVRHYLATVDFAKTDVDLALKAAVRIYAKAGAITEEEFIKKAKSTNFALSAKRVLLFLRIFYLIFILSFLISMCVLAAAIK